MLNESTSHLHGLPSAQDSNLEPKGPEVSGFSKAAQALLDRSDHYYAVALTEGDLVTHWCRQERHGSTRDREISTGYVSALLPTLNLLIQTTPHSSASHADTGARVSYTYTHQDRARALHALIYEDRAVVLITSAQSSSERAYFWLSSHYEALKHHAQASSLGGPLDRAESTPAT